MGPGDLKEVEDAFGIEREPKEAHTVHHVVTVDTRALGVPPTHEHTLSFKNLRFANVQRLPLFKDAKGRPAHSKPDGSDWSIAEWLMAVVGELGEFANLQKKVIRGDLTADEAKEALAKEIADVIIYMDLLAFQFRLDLGEIVIKKWNETSGKVDVNLRLSEDGTLLTVLSPSGHRKSCGCDMMNVDPQCFPVIPSAQGQ